MTNPAAPTSVREPIRWGAYLACSWTWCIGMFLPILLLREMGWAGFLIFALPNIIGAAAMGWVIKTRADSVRFVETHAGAVWWFSAITLAFHLYWIFWLSSFLPLALGIPGPYLAGGIGLVAVFVAMTGWTVLRGKTPITALALLLISLTVLLGTFFSPELREANASLLRLVPQSAAALCMLPVMVFGFLLCPYLDITFHHARQRLDSTRNGRLGFTLGFVVFFPFMIFLTTRYAGLFAGAMHGEAHSPALSPWLAVGLLLHLLCQWIFTVSVHLDRLRTLPAAASKKTVLVALLIIAGILGALVPGLPAYRGLGAGEIGYRLFMSAYGLAFPAYMLYRVIAPKNGAPSNPYILGLAIGLATPFFWVGFIERQTLWLLPGMVILLLGAFIRPKTRAS